MAYQSNVWLGSIAALCPSQDTAGDGTTTLTDFTGVGNGTLTSMDASTDWVTDDGKRALDFDGSNDYVATPQCPLSAVKCFAISVWFRRVATTGNGLFIGIANAINSATERILVYHFSDGNLYIQIDGAFGYFAQSLTDQNWHSLIVHYDGTQTGNANRLKAWVDGSAKTLTFSGTIAANVNTITTPRLFVGLIANSPTLYGAFRMDDLRILPRVYTDEERAEIHASRGGTYAAASGGGVRLVNIRGGADQ